MTFEYSVPYGINHAPLRLYAVQGEAGARTFTLNFPGVGAIPMTTANVYVKKNDGTLVVISATPGTTKVTFTLPLQACTCPGENRVYVQLLGGGVETRWDNILLYVEPCDLENAVASTNDLGPLANLITDPDYIQRLEDAYTGAAAQLEALMDQFAPTGDYSPEKSYQPLNIAGYQGGSYVAMKPTKGNPPTDTTYWQLLAAPGQKGDPGEPGQKGQKGDPGKGLELGDIGGPYNSLEELQSAVPAPEEDSSYFVGAGAPYDVVRYREGGWQNLGPLQGAPGPANTLTIGAVETLEPGEPATAEITGEAPNQTLSLGIPRGQDGSAGQGGVTLQQVIDALYPVGHIEVTTDSANPGTRLPGTTWELFGAGKTLVGVDGEDSDFNAVGKTGGAKEVDLSHFHATRDATLTVEQLPSHGHVMDHSHGAGSLSTGYAGSHKHTVDGNTQNTFVGGTFRAMAWKNTADFATGDFSVQANNTEFDRVAPGSGSDWGAKTFNLNGSHSHPIKLDTTSQANHYHSVTGDTATHNGDTGYTGGGAAHSHGNTQNATVKANTLQPYVTCYFWKRTA